MRSAYQATLDRIMEEVDRSYGVTHDYLLALNTAIELNQTSLEQYSPKVTCSLSFHDDIPHFKLYREVDGLEHDLLISEITIDEPSDGIFGVVEDLADELYSKFPNNTIATFLIMLLEAIALMEYRIAYRKAGPNIIVGLTHGEQTIRVVINTTSIWLLDRML